MKNSLAILLMLISLSCNVTKNQQAPDVVTTSEVPIVQEKQNQVYIPNDALDVTTPPSSTTRKTPPPPPPPPKDTEVFKVVDKMPMFPGCKELEGDNREKELCAKEKMLEYNYSNLVYPQKAIDNKVEGMCVLQFIVTQDGSIKDCKVVRDIGSGCGQAAVDVVNQMNSLPDRWVSGSQRGRPVQVLYTFPVRFDLSRLDEYYEREK